MNGRTATIESERRVSRVVVAVLVLAGVGTGALAFRQMGREWREVARGPDASGLPALGLVPPFSLTRQDSKPFSMSDLAGSIWIADFIFTRCAGPCPRLTQKMAELRGVLAGRPDVRFVSFSVDPDNDTPEVLAEYAAHFGADVNRWVFLTGDRVVIHRLIREGFKLTVEGDQPPEHQILHSTYFVLVDRGGRIRGYYDGDDPQRVSQLVMAVTDLARGSAGP